MALERLARRVTSVDAQQYLALYLIALLVALLGSWPGDAATPNDSWFTLAYTRAAVLGLLALGYGVSAALDSPAERRTLVALMLLIALLALPVEIAAYAASYPLTPLWWAVALPVLTGPAFLGLGILIGLALAKLRLTALGPVLVPMTLAGMVAFDVYLGVNIMNPFTAAVRVSLPHLAVLALLLVATALAMRESRRPSSGEAVA